jgi:hypothetical protein
MPINNEMPIPDWADALKQTMFSEHQATPIDTAKMKPLDKTSVVAFSTHFGEWELKGDDVLIHVFPRDGADDQWTDGRYINRCRNCKAEVPVPASLRELKPCVRCDHAGLVYVPGRREVRTEHQFPPDTKGRILAAADAVWEGDVAIEFVEELGAFVVQLQGAKSVPWLDSSGGMLDRFFERLDNLLESK